jgi:hypothetical protein
MGALQRFRLSSLTSESGQIHGMGESAVSDTEADEMEEHLRGLGYIE